MLDLILAAAIAAQGNSTDAARTDVKAILERVRIPAPGPAGMANPPKVSFAVDISRPCETGLATQIKISNGFLVSTIPLRAPQFIPWGNVTQLGNTEQDVAFFLDDGSDVRATTTSVAEAERLVGAAKVLMGACHAAAEASSTAAPGAPWERIPSGSNCTFARLPNLTLTNTGAVWKNKAAGDATHGNVIAELAPSRNGIRVYSLKFPLSLDVGALPMDSFTAPRVEVRIDSKLVPNNLHVSEPISGVEMVGGERYDHYHYDLATVDYASAQSLYEALAAGRDVKFRLLVGNKVVLRDTSLDVASLRDVKPALDSTGFKCH